MGLPLASMLGALMWRWKHITQAALLAGTLYLFPAWCSRWSWNGIILLIIILAGYGNMKYLLLMLPMLYPVRHYE